MTARRVTLIPGDGIGPEITEVVLQVLAGKGVANPSALLLAACLMLDHLDDMAAADRIRGALEATLLEGAVRTPDLKGNATTTEFTDAVLGRLG
jgi:isocitrate dehydrogenase (NAD+)